MQPVPETAAADRLRTFYIIQMYKLIDGNKISHKNNYLWSLC